MKLNNVFIALIIVLSPGLSLANWLHDELRSNDGLRIVTALIYLMSHPEHYGDADEHGQTLHEIALMKLEDPALADYLVAQTAKPRRMPEPAASDLSQIQPVQFLGRDILSIFLRNWNPTPTLTDINRYRSVSRAFGVSACMAFSGRSECQVRSAADLARLMLLADSGLAQFIGTLVVDLSDQHDSFAELIRGDLMNVECARAILHGFDDGSVSKASLLARLALVYLPLFLEKSAHKFNNLHTIKLRTNLPHLSLFLQPFVSAITSGNGFPALKHLSVHSRFLEPLVRSEILKGLPNRPHLSEVDIVGFPKLSSTALVILLASLPIRAFRASRDISLCAIFRQVSSGGFQSLEEIDARGSFYNPSTHADWQDATLDLNRFKSLKRLVFGFRADQVAWCDVLLRTPSNAPLIAFEGLDEFLDLGSEVTADLINKLRVITAFLELPIRAMEMNPALQRLRTQLVEIVTAALAAVPPNLL